jgi:hypothetical protein
MPPEQLTMETALDKELDKIKLPKPMSARGGISIALWFIDKIGDPRKAKVFLDAACQLQENLKTIDETKTSKL